MSSVKGWSIVLLFSMLIVSGCLDTPSVDKEKAGYLAGIKFLETHPGQTASYTVKDPGGDAFIVYFNVTSSEGVQLGFAEYYVDRFNRDIYVSSSYATVLATGQSPNLERLFNRYPEAKSDGSLIKTESPEGRKYAWEIRIITNGVEIAVFRFDAVEEKLLGGLNIKTADYSVNLQPV